MISAMVLCNDGWSQRLRKSSIEGLATEQGRRLTISGVLHERSCQWGRSDTRIRRVGTVDVASQTNHEISDVCLKNRRKLAGMGQWISFPATWQGNGLHPCESLNDWNQRLFTSNDVVAWWLYDYGSKNTATSANITRLYFSLLHCFCDTARYRGRHTLRW